MNAVAIMTPEPKYFATKNAQSGRPTPRCRLAYTGNAAPAFVSDQAVEVPKDGMLRIPNNEPNSMTKMAEMRRPIRPSKSFSEVHAGVVANAAAAADGDASASRAMTLAMACIPSFPPAH